MIVYISCHITSTLVGVVSDKFRGTNLRIACRQHHSNVIVWFLVSRLLSKYYDERKKNFCCPHIVTPILPQRKATNNNRTSRESSFITHFFFSISTSFSSAFKQHAYAPLTHSHMPPAQADFKFIYSFFS